MAITFIALLTYQMTVVSVHHYHQRFTTGFQVHDISRRFLTGITPPD
jgi:hypothetical protein